MYQKILAPLDGSKFSECSLQHVKMIATGCHVPQVVLLRVMEPVNYGHFLDREMAKIMLAAEDEAKKYLSDVANDLKKDGLSVETAVISGFPANEILDYADKNNIDLIVMSTHGRSGISRWTSGSVTDRVVRTATVPVLTIAPPGCRSQVSL